MNSQKQHGLTIVELMVSMAIGLVVIGAVFVNYLNSSVGSRHAAAMVQVTDDASLALGILRNHIAMAGYSSPTGISSDGVLQRQFSGVFILGCDGGFASDAAAKKNDPTQVTCVTGQPASNGPDSILVRYEADGSNAPVVNNMPADCIGTALTANGSIMDNRFGIDAANDQLECQGNGGTGVGDPDLQTAKQPLLDNVADMQITYGMSDSVAGTPGKNVVRYVTASQVALPGSASWQDSWNNVISVRVCLLVRSTKPALDQNASYIDCNNTRQDLTNDRRIYRAFTTTVTLNNRIANKDPTAAPSTPTTPTTPAPAP